MDILYHHRTRGQKVERVHIIGVVKALRQLGHQVMIVCPPGTNSDKLYPDTRSEHARKRLGWNLISRYFPEFLFECLEVCYNLYAYFQMKHAIRNYRIDLIYERYALFGFAGVLLARIYKIPVFLEINDAASVERNRDIRLKILASKIEQWVFRHASTLITVSSVFGQVIANGGIPERKIRIIPNAVDPDIFDGGQFGSRVIREKHNLGDRIVIGYVGGFALWHRLDFLVDVITRLVPECPNIHCLLVGDGFSKASLEDYADHKKMTSYFTFTGRISHEQIPEYIAAMDIAVLPHANRYCSPVKLFEYMAMGKPVVVPRLANMQDVLTEGINGILFEPGDSEQFKEALSMLIESREQRAFLGDNARRTVYSKHLWLNNAQQIIGIYMSDFC